MKVCNHRFAFDYKQRSSSDSGSTSGRDSESVVRRVVDGQEEETNLVFVTFPSCAHTTVCFQSFFLWLLLFIFC